MAGNDLTTCSRQSNHVLHLIQIKLPQPSNSKPFALLLFVRELVLRLAMYHAATPLTCMCMLYVDRRGFVWP